MEISETQQTLVLCDTRSLLKSFSVFNKEFFCFCFCSLVTWSDLILFSPLLVLAAAQEAGGGPRKAVVRQPGVLFSDKQRPQEAFCCLLVVFYCDLEGLCSTISFDNSKDQHRHFTSYIVYKCLWGAFLQRQQLKSWF